MSLTVDSLDLFRFLRPAGVSLGELSDHRVGAASTVMEMNERSHRGSNATCGRNDASFAADIEREAVFQKTETNRESIAFHEKRHIGADHHRTRDIELILARSRILE